MNRNALVVVILDPQVTYTPDAKELPVLFREAFGEQDRTKWAKDDRRIASAKAALCWRTGMSTRTVGEKAPYLYQEGDVKYPGGVICDSLIVAASGLDWQLDEAIAHMVIAFFWAQARLERDRIMANNEQIYI